MDASPTTLHPPQGGTYGSQSLPQVVSTPTVTGPGQIKGNGWTLADDTTVGFKTQTCSGTLSTTVWAYWLDDVQQSNPGTPPSYAVILQQSGTFKPAPGNPPVLLTNADQSCGYFQIQVDITVNVIEAAAGVTFSGNPQRLAFAPQMVVADQQGMIAVQSAPFAPFPMRVYDGGGFNSGTFTPVINEAISIPEWGVSPSSSTGDLDSSWTFYQETPWDQLRKPASGYSTSKSSSWQSMLFDPKSGDVVSMSSPSIGTVNTTTYIAWKIVPEPSTVTWDPTSGAPLPPSLNVTLSGSFLQTLAFVHNSQGCAGVNGKGNHLYYWTPGLVDPAMNGIPLPLGKPQPTNWSTTIDLATVVSQRETLA